MSEDRGRPAGHLADAGETLVELLVSLVILGITGAAIIGSLMLAVDLSKMHEQHVLVRQTLHAWAEKVRNITDDAYGSCGEACFLASAPSVPGVTPSVSDIECWKGSAFGPCAGETTKRVRLTVTGSSLAMPGVSESLVVTLRRPCLEASTC